MRIAVWSIMMTAAAAGTTVAEARSFRSPPPVIVELPPLEAKGCYYYRGERHCGSYCYWEVNGRRYCQQREREAFPQAELWIDEPLVEPVPARGRSGQRLK